MKPTIIKGLVKSLMNTIENPRAVRMTEGMHIITPVVNNAFQLGSSSKHTFEIHVVKEIQKSTMGKKEDAFVLTESGSCFPIVSGTGILVVEYKRTKKNDQMPLSYSQWQIAIKDGAVDSKEKICFEEREWNRATIIPKKDDIIFEGIFDLIKFHTKSDEITEKIVKNIKEKYTLKQKQ